MSAAGPAAAGFENVILKGVGGRYTVHTADGPVQAAARGLFRLKGIVPLPGDIARLQRQADSWLITDIAPRKNSFVRPALANVDVLFVVVSTTQPVPSTRVLDRLLAIAALKDVQAVLLLTKNDLADGQQLLQLYRQAGFTAFAVDAAAGTGLDEVRALLAGRLGVFCGNSGVGKSTLLNALLPGAELATGAISQKLGRGRHTTRQVELFWACGGLAADTPGFSSLDMDRVAPIEKEQLQYAFIEFAPYWPHCRFTGCSHTGEKGCAVCEAVAKGLIAQSRYRSYCEMYAEAKERQPWAQGASGAPK